jgi:hypothetical protein
MGESSTSGEVLLERFDRMSQLHAQNAEELAFLTAKKKRLEDTIAADRSAASARDDYLPKLHEALAGLMARVQLMEAEELKVAAKLAAVNAQSCAALTSLEADVATARAGLDAFSTSSASQRIQAEIDDVRYAHEAERQSLEAEAAQVEAKLGAQTWKQTSVRDQEEREATELKNRLHRSRAEIKHNEQQIKELMQTAADDESEFEKRLARAKQACLSDDPSSFEVADPEVVARYKRSLLDMDREIARLKQHLQRRAQLSGTGGQGHRQQQYQPQPQQQQHSRHRRNDLSALATTIASDASHKRKKSVPNKVQRATPVAANPRDLKRKHAGAPSSVTPPAGARTQTASQLASARPKPKVKASRMRFT